MFTSPSVVAAVDVVATHTYADAQHNANWNSLKVAAQNKPVWFGCNVGADRDRDSGIMDIGIHDYKQIGYNNKMTKEEKLRKGKDCFYPPLKLDS